MSIRVWDESPFSEMGGGGGGGVLCGLRVAVGVSAAWMARKWDGLRFSQPKPASTIDYQRQRFGVWQGFLNVLEESAF